MAGSTFDFELVADDKASGVIRQIEGELSRLRPTLKDAGERLRLGGDETISGMGTIGDKLRDISDFAKGGVQSIGDMIPPLKNLGALTGGLMKAGGIGAMIAGGQKYMTEAAENGTKNVTSAKNMGMSVEESTRLSGTLVQKGASKDEASGIMESYYEKLSQANKGQDGELLASIKSIGAELVKNKDGSVNITKTLESLEAAIQELPDSRNWELRDKLKLPPELIALLKEGKGKLKERMARSDKIGLTVSDEHAERMDKLNTKIKDLGAEFEGAGNKLEKGIFDFLYNDSMLMKIPDFGDVDKATNRIKEVEERANDTPDNFYHGDKRKDLIARALKDEDYKKSLSFYEKTRLIAYDPTEAQYKAIEEKYGIEWEKQKKLAEERKNMPRINIGDKIPDYWSMTPNKDPRVRAFRNNNPGNVREASNEIGRDEPGVDIYGNKKGFAIFQDENDARAALARQLLLYMDRGNNTLDGIMRKYAPRKDNNKTGEYIRYMSQHMEVGPYQPLDLYDPDVLARAMSGIIKKESGYQPYTYKEMMDSIDDATNNPKWAGKRNPTRLMEQRDRWYLESEQQQEATSQSAPSITMNDVSANANIAEVIGEAIRLGLAENQSKGTLEIVLTNPVTGAKQLLNVNTTGRITTAMDLP
ncbi:hypothetical protein PJ702_000175 [Providencia rettgeri]|nr:hypothetical protein [Providencia rettgeri]ELR5281588.1 hypothetical protein [Providencia rettgeri]